MHRNVKVALGGAALSLGVVVGMPTAALADTLDCTNAEIAAKYPAVCVPTGQPITGEVTSPGTGGGNSGGGTAGGGTVGRSISGGGGGAASLPFTGDEILVLGLAGAAALAVGTTLTVAGRRRGATTA